jgi:hypothetical protein
MRWARYIVRIGDIRNACNISVVKSERKGHLGDRLI